MIRKAFFHREVPMGEDVADAIENIIARDRFSLPMAIMKETVAFELMKLANTDDDGNVIKMSAHSKRYAQIDLRNTLQTSSVFQTGYEKYEQRSGNSVVPVTDFLFRYVYTDDTRDSLDAMTETEITQSLPKRPSYPRNAAGEAEKHPIPGYAYRTDDDGNPILKCGEVAGIVVYPPKAIQSRLLAAWLGRRANVALGQLDHFTESVSLVRPAAKEILAENSKVMRKSLLKSLPKPRE